jgi:hypothetical protein
MQRQRQERLVTIARSEAPRRPDPLASAFEIEVVPMLKAAPGVQAIAIFEEMSRRHPELKRGRS